MDINLDGTASPATFLDATGGPSVVTIGSEVPEPATVLLLVGGLAGLSLAHRRTRATIR